MTDARRAGIAGDLFVATTTLGAWPVNEVVRISGPFDELIPAAPPSRPPDPDRPDGRLPPRPSAFDQADGSVESASGSQPRRAGDAGAADPAVAAGILREVLLVVGLGVVEAGAGRISVVIAPEAGVLSRLVGVARGGGRRC